ncbi:UDP-N-acetylmuramoyl-L-alanyl-D-glutamate--2,6-diaminopimelate ligase [uncultured Eubacterium sp.]|uniref:UDP-N-acetylmuramoyl-L-alanyl-D-glutamate--2, 6-diaminopimelate ligase n=1 Tax=uncultured Eubacterium sp. TaxID=165185 RepID=UPI0025F7631E|nr:UDP-N-acetylmuramoyl-L-alanyl-D-glutamate--2,6-diaminopimelate ligase [uncultured Eubacterium sp.]
MRQTEKLLQELNCRRIRGELPREVTQVTYDSRKTEQGALFVCIRGSRQDGHAFIREAMERGAAVILTEEGAMYDKQIDRICELFCQDAQGNQGESKSPEQDFNGNIEQEIDNSQDIGSLQKYDLLKEDDGSQNNDKKRKICVLETSDTRVALASISRQWFDNPQEKLNIIGVTGTKGKTTTVWMIWKMLAAAGMRCGLIGTIEVCYGSWQQESSHTTPESYELYEILQKMVENGCHYVVMEVSSQALKLHRVDGIVFEAAVFTNLREDHIGAGEHTDFAEYVACKHRLFCQCRTGIFNQDDPYWQEMRRGSSCRQVITYGFSRQADYQASNSRLLRGSDRLAVQYELSRKKEKRTVVVNAPGKFSIYNSLAAIAVAKHYRLPQEAVDQVLHTIQVPGRIEMLPVSPRFIVIVDYAHNAMALEALLTTLRDYHPGRIICIFGCGGNRASERRFQMGEAAGRLSDLTVVTTDNPREEDPEKIADEICLGLEAAKGKYGRIPDREEAISYGISHAKPGDIVVIAGKGHETYQEIQGQKYPMDDRKLAMKCKVW